MNRKRCVSAATLMVMCGATVMGFGGCLGLNLDRLLRFGAAVAATEFVIDNDGIFDLFPDGAGG